MERKSIAKKLLVAVLVLAMIVTLTPVSFAAPTNDQSEAQMESSDNSSGASEKAVAFVKKARVGDTIVRLEAEPGVFPEDAELIVEKAGEKDEAKAAGAIDKVRPDDLIVADSYTFDIKVVDSEGNELQPADDQKVDVTFNMKSAADHNLSAAIYHIAEKEVIDKKTKEPETVLKAEKLKTKTDKKEHNVTTKTDGFSLYTVEFAYREMNYAAKSMEDTDNKANNYIEAVDSWNELQNRVNNASSGEVIHLGKDITASGGDDRILIKNKTVTIDLNGHILNRNRSSNDSDGHVIEIQNSTNLTIKDSSTEGTGVITGGYASNGGGVHVGKGTTCTIEGGTITGNKANIDGGGIYVRGTLVMTGGTVTKNEAKDTAGGIYCQDTGTFDLSNVTISENTSKNDGGGLIVHLAKNARISNCRIINNKSKTEDGGALRMEAKEKTLTIEDGTEISGNECENQGGAIVIYEGRVNMAGGKISNNKSEDGGGVYNDGGTIDLNGVEVSGNKTTKEGGGGINNHNNAYLRDCTIINNECKNVGGGLYTNDDTEITGCEFGANKASSDGGAIHIKNSNVKITNCTFKENVSGGSGGAVRCKDGNITITGSSMEENNANSKGGGISISDDATVNLSESEILGNLAADCAGGVYVGGDADKFKVSGRVVILGNVSSLGANVFLYTYTSGYYQSKSKKITVSGKLAGESNIGVTIEDEFDDFSRPVTDGFNKYHSGDEAAEYFTAEKGGVQKDENGEVVFSKSDWPYLQAQINKAADGSTLLIKKNWKAADTDKALTIPAGKTLTIDLNGFTLDRNRASMSVSNGGGVFEVNGTLTLIDSRGKGSIKGGNAVKGGGVYVSETGSFNLENGAISGNKATKGAGIYNDGRCNITGGAIKANAAKDGGAVYNASENLTVSGGDIITNRANDNGGGIYNAGGAVLDLTTPITENNAGVKGGGIYNDGSGIINVSGDAAAKENSASSGAGIMLAGSSKLNITDVLSSESSFDLTAEMPSPTKDNPNVERILTSGLSDNGGEGAAAKFSYDGKPYGESTDVTLKDGELVVSKTVSADKWVSSWAELKNALNSNKNNGKTIALSNDIKPITSEDKSYAGILSVVIYEVDAPNMTLELCGHTIDRESCGGPVFKIARNSTLVGPESITLTIRDSIGTGAVTGGTPYETGSDFVKSDGGGINIGEDCTCNLENVTVRGNRSAANGGGISVEGTLNMRGGGVSGNTTEKSGGGIYYSDNKKINLTGVTVSGNTAKDSGGGLNIKKDGTISGCVITGNITKEGHGGGINFDANNKTLTINDTEISENVAVYDEKAADMTADPEENNGGGINVKKGTLNMNGGVICGNRAENGGGVSCGDSTVNLTEVVVRNNTVTGEDVVDESLFYDDETILGGHGGGIINKNKLVLKSCNIKDNSAENTGGGIWTDDSVTIEDSTIASNIAESEGGGIHISSGTTKVKGGAGGSVITDNTAYLEGSGVKADKSFYVEGKVLIKDNADSSNVFLNSGKNIILDNALTEDSRIAVGLKKGFGIFTEKYKDYHPAEEPEKYFISDYGYGVHKAANGEAEIKLDLDDGSQFIDMDNRVNDFEKLNKRNWMSGISGDRYINEINIPCTHDAGMNNVNYHVMSSIGSVLRYKDYAKTQTRYIDEQLDDGIRRIDVRLNNRYEESHFFGVWISYEDDGKNLWLCHGKSYIGGTFWAGNHDNDDLNLNEVFGWVKDFLKKHPTETIIMDFQAEPVSSLGHSTSKDTKTIYSRLRQILEKQNKEINPSTGESYIYWQNGEFEEFTSYPKLKDCRGKIVVNSEEGNVGGIVKSEHLGIPSYGLPADTELTESAEMRVEHVRQFFNLHCQKDIPKNVTEHLDRINTASTNCAPATLKIPYETPLEVADVVHGSLISKGKEFDQRGKYVGWIRLDGATGKTNRFIWISNFPEDYDDNELEYCTVTVKSGIDPESVSDPDKVKDQKYRILKGTEIPIPGNIYGYDKELSGWDATVPSGEETGSETQYRPDSTYKVMNDVTFTANWGSEATAPPEVTTKVKVVWDDEDNEDEIRPENITVHYKKSGTEDVQTIGFPQEGNAEEAWETTVNGDVTDVTSVTDGGIRIIPTVDYPQGQDKEGEYSYEVINSKLTGCTITIKHTPTEEPEPEEDVMLTGSISWNDNYDAAEKRPKSVIVHLLKDGKDTGYKNEISDSTNWNWFFVLSSLEDYDPDAEYTVSQDPVPYYTTEITGSAAEGYIFKNTIVPAGHVHELTEVPAKEATCLEDGNIRYWICNKGEEPCNRCFSDGAGENEVDPDKTSDEGGIIIPATGHEWGEPDYEWAKDNSKVTGICVCENDHDHKIEETVNAESEETKSPTETEAGERTYTAIFKGDNDFEDQTKTEVIPPTGGQEGGGGSPDVPADDDSTDTSGQGGETDKDSKKDPQPAPTPKPIPESRNVKGISLARMMAKGNTRLTIGWKKIKGVDGYDIFFSRCNHSGRKINVKKIKSIKGNMIFKCTIKGLKKGVSYKAYVKAYVKEKGKKKYVKKSPLMHAYTGNATKKYTNAKAVKVKKIKITLKKGKALRIKAKVVKVIKNKQLMPNTHSAKIRYKTSNKKIARVSKFGKIRAVGKGKCCVYAYAHNGASRKIKITVK